MEICWKYSTSDYIFVEVWKKGEPEKAESILHSDLAAMKRLFPDNIYEEIETDFSQKEERRKKAYKLEVLVIDLEEQGEESIKEEIEYAAGGARVMSIEEKDIGVWSDDHPLNKKDTRKAEYKRLFGWTPASGICPNCGKKWETKND